MKLKSVQVTEFKSVWDSNEFTVSDITCLVGKNEAGKTSLLRALYRLNPIIKTDDKFDLTDDYPRSAVEDYQQEIEQGIRKQQAEVVRATFTLDEEELKQVAEWLGDKALKEPVLELSKRYPDEKGGKSPLWYTLRVDDKEVIAFLVDDYELAGQAATDAKKAASLEDLEKILTTGAQKHEAAVANAHAAAQALTDETQKATALEKSKGLAETEQEKALRGRVGELRSAGGFGAFVFAYLKPRIPEFLYFDEYYQLTGHDNIDQLKQRKKSNTLRSSDYPLLGLIEVARLDLDKITNTQRTQELKNKLEGASNYLTTQILKFWSQNRHLEMTFDVRPAMAEDPPEMQSGLNIWGEVYDSKHRASTGLGTRSRGFVWFFSFLAWYSSVKKQNKPVVLLLDEPGLSLHGKAQEDLLRYFEAEIAKNPKHQLIYTTHSPFMVDPAHYDRVRIVQDKGIDTDAQLPRAEDGTKVFTEVLEAGPDSLFPLQGALGYEIYQNLFIGPNSVVVEGVSDLLYIQTISGLLQAAGKKGLDDGWTITPVGGAENVPTFVSLIGSQKGLKVATLIDIAKTSAQRVENLYKRKLLKKANVLTFGQFTGKAEADIEDMFDEDFYIDLVNAEFKVKLKKKDLTNQSPRILVRIEEYNKTSNALVGFNHYRPARYFSENASKQKPSADTLDRFQAAFDALNALL